VGKRKGSSPDSPSGRADAKRLGKGNVGKPSKVIDYEKLKSLAALGMTHKSMAVALGIHETSWSYFCAKDPQFETAYKSGRQLGEQRLLTSLMQMVQEKNLGAVIFALKAIYGYREKVTVEHTGDPENPIVHKHAHMTEYEINSRIKELMSRGEANEVRSLAERTVDTERVD
jgi:hypothetical protein